MKTLLSLSLVVLASLASAASIGDSIDRDLKARLEMGLGQASPSSGALIAPVAPSAPTGKYSIAGAYDGKIGYVIADTRVKTLDNFLGIRGFNADLHLLSGVGNKGAVLAGGGLGQCFKIASNGAWGFWELGGGHSSASTRPVPIAAGGLTITFSS